MNCYAFLRGDCHNANSGSKHKRPFQISGNEWADEMVVEIGPIYGVQW